MLDIIAILTEILRLFWPISSKMLVFGSYLGIVHFIASSFFAVFLSIAAVITVFYLTLVFYVVLFVKDRKEPEKRFDAKKAPFVSIHIPTCNELAAITCAKRCLAFDYPKNKMEILIGDDSNKPDVSKQLEAFASQHQLVRLIKRGNNIGYKSGNLNNLIKHSRGEFFVIFDSDFMPSQDFLKRIITPFIYDNRLSAVQARWNPVNAGQNLVSILSASITYIFHFISLPFLKDSCDTVTLCGSAEAVRRSHLEKMNGWKTGSFTEDIEYSFRLFQQNKKVLYLEDLECDCEVPFKPTDLYRQQMRWAYGVVSALKQHFLKTMISNTISYKRKLPLVVSGFGYTFTVVLLLMIISGSITLISLPVYPTYETTKHFLFNTLIAFIFTIGPFIASILVLYLNNKVKYTARLVVSLFSIGIVTVYFVSLGVLKALLNRTMQWFLVTKNGNKLSITPD